MSQELLSRGINVLPVLYPAVPVKSSRLRFFLTAMHTEQDIETAIDTTVEELAKFRRGCSRSRCRPDRLSGHARLTDGQDNSHHGCFERGRQGPGPALCRDWHDARAVRPGRSEA